MGQVKLKEVAATQKRPAKLEDPGGKLVETLELARDKQLVILISGHPDPDAIGSALAHQHMCNQLGVEATIAHALPISRPENRALVKLLNVDLLEISDEKMLEQFDYLSLVDTHHSEPTLQLPESLKLLSIVDHHRTNQPIEAPFLDLRPDVGATCTMYARYFEAGHFPLDQGSADHARLATALYFGIETDTDDFSLASAEDFMAAAYLKPRCDVSLLRQFGHRAIAAEAMDALTRALANLEVIRDFAIAGVGSVSLNNRDAIATAADFILRREDIDTVLVYGLVEGRIDGSLRTTSATVDPAKFLGSVFGNDETGRPYGGGRADKGGFQIPLGLLSECEEPDKLWELAQAVVRLRVSRAVPELKNGNS